MKCKNLVLEMKRVYMHVNLPIIDMNNEQLKIFIPKESLLYNY
jgi:hypothetical protein